MPALPAEVLPANASSFFLSFKASFFSTSRLFSLSVVVVPGLSLLCSRRPNHIDSMMPNRIFFTSLVVVTLVSSLLVSAARLPPVENRTSGDTKPQCTEEALTVAAKCKCALLSYFLPQDDFRIQYCTGEFGDDLKALEHHCDGFYNGATSNKKLAAMFVIEKLAGICLPSDLQDPPSMDRSYKEPDGRLTPTHHDRTFIRLKSGVPSQELIKQVKDKFTGNATDRVIIIIIIIIFF